MDSKNEDEINVLQVIDEESSSDEEQEEAGKEDSKSGGYESEDEKSSLSSEDEAPGEKNVIAQNENSYESIEFKNSGIKL